MNTKTIFDIIPPGPNPPKEVFCLVEIPKGSSNKFEYNREYGVFFLDRVLYGAVYFPTEYGIIPQTWSEDEDPLDVMVFSSFHTFPGCLLTCRPIGTLRMIDSGEQDNKIIAVPSKDPRFEKVQDLADIAPHLKKEIKNFWENYSELQPGKKIKVEGWSGKEAAWEIITSAVKNYQEKFNQKKALV